MEIRLCKKEEISLLVDFIKTYWNPNHVLVKRPEVLHWQYQNEDGLNFLIAIENNEIYAVLGLIPLSHFDKGLKENNEAWGALWKIRPDCKIPGLGTYLQRRATKIYDFFGGIGVSQDNINIQNALKNKVVHINHYYVLNRNINDYQIAKINVNQIPPQEISINFSMEERDSLDGIPEIEHSYYPQKSNSFIINKYQNNPFYHYRFLCCKRNNLIEAVIVLKNVEVGNRMACRVIDVLGRIEQLEGLGKAIENYISNNERIEYADFYNSGINKSFFINNGFYEVNDYDDDVIIPNYFEPYLQKNCPLDGIIISDNPEKYSFFKGDADQDRPNI